MAKYVYRPLEDSLNDIRVVEVLPGNFEDDIRLRISHMSLAGVELTPSRSPVDLDAIRATLPSNWDVYAVSENWEHRVLFVDRSLLTKLDTSEQGKTSWDHPDPTFDRSIYCPLAMKVPDVGFEALSYVWGSQDSQITVKVVEGSSCSNLVINENLVCAIRYLRSSVESRMMWIDAICINQGDMEERAVQVRRMGNIYSLADKVVVWLGVHTDDSQKGFDLLERLGECVIPLEDGTFEPSPLYIRHQPDADALWSAHNIVRRPWFDRLWVVQEMVLGNRWTILQCGSTSLSRRLFSGAIGHLGLFMENFPQPSMQATFTSILHDLFDLSYSNVTFAQLIHRHCARGCMDPRDKIHGLLGMAKADFSDLIQPDYAINVHEVYLNASIAEIEASRTLDMLGECVLKGRHLKGPSWVPDWSISTERRKYTPQPNSFSAGASITWHTVLNRDILECQGLTYDSINYVGKVTPPGESINQIEIVKSILTDLFMERLNRFYPSQLSTLRSLALAMCYGRVRERSVYINTPRLYAWMEWLSSVVHDTYTNPSLGESLLSEERTFFDNELRWRLAERSLFITTKGSIGIGPPGIQIGDEVCILLGCDSPIVLRADGNDRHLVVGCVFVDGLEDAKYLLGPLPEDVRPLFRLKDGRRAPSYWNINSNAWVDDPRLPPLDDWELLHQHVVNTPPYALPRYKHKEIGEIVKGDPRMTPDALRARGHDIRSFFLV